MMCIETSVKLSFETAGIIVSKTLVFATCAAHELGLAPASRDDHSMCIGNNWDKAVIQVAGRKRRLQPKAVVESSATPRRCMRKVGGYRSASFARRHGDGFPAFQEEIGDRKGLGDISQPNDRFRY